MQIFHELDLVHSPLLPKAYHNKGIVKKVEKRQNYDIVSVSFGRHCLDFIIYFDDDKLFLNQLFHCSTEITNKHNK